MSSRTKSLVNLIGTAGVKQSIAAGVSSSFTSAVLNLSNISDIAIGAEVDWPQTVDNTMQFQVLTSPNNVNYDTSSTPWDSFTLTFISSSTEMKTINVAGSTGYLKLKAISLVSSGPVDTWGFATIGRRGRA